MNIMTKRGNLDNIVTYEHICDTYEDLQNIDPKYATLGSTAIVINQEEGLNAYMATSAGEWVPIGTASSGGGEGGGITPTGTYNITANGTYNVTRYATAKVNVPEGIFPTGTYNVTKNGVYDVESYLSVNVRVPVKETILSTNKVLIPDNTTKTFLAEDDWFNGYKKIAITPKNIDITTHKTVLPNESVQYVYGDDLVIIPAGVSSGKTTAGEDVILRFNITMDDLSCYYLRSGSLHTINTTSNSEIYELDIELTPQYITPNMSIYGEDVPNTTNTIYIQNNILDITAFSKTSILTEVTITSPIILEKVCNLTSLYDIELNDGSPNLHPYQLDTTKISLVDGNLYALYCKTSTAGSAITQVLFSFIPFMWDSVNGFVSGYFTSALNPNNPLDYPKIQITPDYKLDIQQDNIYRSYGKISICSIDFNNIKNYLDYITVNPIPSNYVPKTNFTIYSSGLAGQGFYATANSESNLNHYSTTNTPTSYWITGNELTLFISSTFDFTNDSTGVTLKSYDAQNGIAILTITDGAIIGVQTQPK